MSGADDSGLRDDLERAVRLFDPYGEHAEHIFDYPGPNIYDIDAAQIRAIGFIEGAALALGMTVAELLDAHDVRLGP